MLVDHLGRQKKTDSYASAVSELGLITQSNNRDNLANRTWPWALTKARQQTLNKTEPHEVAEEVGARSIKVGAGPGGKLGGRCNLSARKALQRSSFQSSCTFCCFAAG